MLKHIVCTVFALLAVMAFQAVSSLACQIPVFRYALENWEPEPYLLIVAHRGELSAADKKLLEMLEQTVGEQRGALNLEVRIVDLAKTTDSVLEQVLATETKAIQTPQMVLIYPLDPARPLSELAPPEPAPGPTAAAPVGAAAAPRGLTLSPSGLTPALSELTPAPLTSAVCPDGKCVVADRGPRIAWMGDLTARHIAQAVQSPARKEIAARLLDGQSAVWVLLECGDKAKDDLAAARLDKKLAEMQRTLKLPDKAAIVADEHYKPETKVELRIEFSVIRIPAEHGEDAIFASTLLNADPNALADREPLAISIFGRGRSYFALVGDGIDAASIEDHCRFVTNDCSCEVKEANPGVDLPFAVAWQKSITKSPSKAQPVPELSGIGALGATEAVSLPPAARATAEPAQQAATQQQLSANSTAPSQALPTFDDNPPATPSSRMALGWVLGPAAAGLVIVLFGTLWLRKGR